MTWQNLGPRSDDTSARAWLAVPVNPADGTRWLYSGCTNWEDDVLRWDPAVERWRMALRGPGATVGSAGPYFPQAGAKFPVATDNGFAVWDGAGGLWVNTVNPHNYSSAIYTRATNAWRAVTAAEFPSYPTDFASLFNAGSASNTDLVVLYGGSLTGAVSHLWTYRPATKAWRKYANHGSGSGKPGAVGNIQNQLRWAAPLGRFILYHSGQVWTLTPDTLMWEPWTTSGTAPTSKHLNPDGTIIQGLGLEIVGNYAVVFGGNPSIYALNLSTRAWQRVANVGTAPNRFNGAFWSSGGSLYQTWGTGQAPGTGADVWVYRDVVTALGGVTRPVISAIGRLA